MSVAVKVSIFVTVAFLVGVGTAYAPVPTFTVVAAAFALALWWFISDSNRFKLRVPRGVNQRSKPKPRSAWTTRLVSGYLLAWWVVLISPIATYVPRGATSAEVATAVAQGSLRNQVLVISFGIVGSVFLPTAIKRCDPPFRWIAALWALYLCWALASLSWSMYPPLTLRNAGALVLVSVGSFGLGAGFYGSLPNGRDLFLRHVFAAGILSALVVLVPLPLHWNQYDLLDPAQRVSIGENVSMTTFVARPAVCALLALAGAQMLQVRQWLRRDWLWVAVLVLPVLVLKTRGPVLWGMLALLILYLTYRTLLRDRILQVGMLLVIGIGTYVYHSEGVFGWLVPYLTRGSVENTESLTGRIPLWQLLIPEIGQHPWLGVGFGAFWNPDNVYQIEQRTGFPWGSAHNGFLEELLNTGIVGLAILLTFFLYATAVVVRRARQGDPLGWLAFLFLLYYLLLNLTNALIQEYLEVPLVIIQAILGLMSSKPTHPPTQPGGAPNSAQRPVKASR